MKVVEIYTDGSALKNPKGGFFCGSGCVLLYKGKEKKISESLEDATVNIAELTAPLLGLKCLKEKCRVTIFSDSQYTIDCITKWYTGWSKRGWKTQNQGGVKNKELIQQLHSLCKEHEVTWVKVKSHSGNHYNDIADELAVAASTRLKEDNI